jgi:hypothetical protein
MAAWRILGSVVLVLTLAGSAIAQTYPLAETPKPGDCYRFRLDMTLSGELRINKDGKQVPIKLEARARQEFPERVLLVGRNNLPQKVARSYEAVKATITVDGDRSERTLRPDRQLIIAQREKDQVIVYCPAGPLTREELELTAEHFDTLSLVGLLPGKPVVAGQTWKVENAVVQALCSFDGLTAQDLTCKLESVRDNTATVSVSGTASGLETGAVSKLSIQARYQFNLADKHLTRLEWKQTDERGQGPASPASRVESTIVVERSAMDQPECLGDVALVSVPDGFDVPLPLLQLLYRDQKGRFDLTYLRQWQTVAQTDDHLVLRLMDDGEFVAQATLTPWTRAEAGQHLSPEEFGEAMADTPGWDQEDLVEEGETRLGEGYWGYRISAVGRMDGLKVMQNFYLVASPAGAQAVVLVTMTPAQAEKLGTRDMDLVRGIAFKK